MQAAIAIAKTHHLRIVPVTEKGKRAYVVYRELPGCSRGVRVGRRNGQRALLSLVKHAAGIADDPKISATPQAPETAF